MGPIPQTAPVADNATAASESSENAQATQLERLQRQLEESEYQRSLLSTQFQAASDEQGNAQPTHLRQENQRLKLRLKEARATQAPRLLSEQQIGLIIGAGIALLFLMIGLAARGGHRQRSQWIN